MVDLIWTSQALDDLDSVCLYIARDSPHYANVFARRAFEVADRLQRFPFSGRIVPETANRYIRELIIGNYRLIYRVGDELVEILTVHHGARELGPLPGSSPHE
ncbi:MAG: type II toxin-antitoxin system RelE/ParE family toxin [Candidatus Coatesbacteria bacterium]|nr:type II toxin-antitoxin system RelE/ParE family toxin [Candidatus Coatesbacteria bacterium]